MPCLASHYTYLHLLLRYHVADDPRIVALHLAGDLLDMSHLDETTQQGLGLGLYIACEIARAHKGTLDVSSTSEETRFTSRMPTH